MKRRTLALALVLSFQPARVLAGGSAVEFTISPSYSVCLSSTAPCTPLARLSFSAKYARRYSRTRSFRIKLAREYQQSTTDDAGQGILLLRASQAATDTLNARLRFFDGAGYERDTVQAGYSYQHSLGNSPTYHTIYGFDDFFFGRPIERGSDGPARRFDVVLRLSENLYQSNLQLPQSYVLLTPEVTFPLNPSGTWRTNANYTIQQQFAGGGKLAPSSWRFTATVTRDFNPSIKAFVRFDTKKTLNPNAASGSQRATLLIGGVNFTL